MSHSPNIVWVFAAASLLALGGALPSCGNAAQGCTPGQQSVCTCDDGSSSVQTCASDGSRFDACDCTQLTPTEGKSCSDEGTLRCGQSISGSDQAALFCKAGTYTKVFECPGFQNCHDSTYDRVDCSDTSFAQTGAPCANEGRQVCSFDADTVLICQSGTWVEAIHCPPQTCKFVPESAGQQCSGTWCSNCGLSEGDICSFDAGSVLCSTDLTKVLQCSAGVATVKVDCDSQGQTCTLLGPNLIGCN